MRWLINRLSVRDEEGFTLIELLVVVGILAILAAIAAPRIVEVINKSREARSEADMKVISSAIERYYADKGVFPSKLADLKTERYLKFDVSFQNGAGKYYLYVVNEIDDGDATNGVELTTAYVLADPGSNPASGTVMHLKADGAVPEGDPTKAHYWVTGSGGQAITIKETDGTTDFTDESVGAYCITANPACRTDIITD